MMTAPSEEHAVNNLDAQTTLVAHRGILYRIESLSEEQEANESGAETGVSILPQNRCYSFNRVTWDSEQGDCAPRFITVTGRIKLFDPEKFEGNYWEQARETESWEGEVLKISSSK